MKILSKVNRVLFLVAMLLFVNLMYCQSWEQNEFVDEFGDKTGEKYSQLLAEGVFSNSATQNSGCSYLFVDSGEDMYVKIYEYNRSLATSIESAYVTVNIKTNGEIVKLKKAFFSKRGSVFFEKENYEAIKTILNTKGEHKIQFKGTRGSSTYLALITIK